MIKSSTLSKNKSHKPLVKEKQKLDLKLMQSLELIKESNAMISELNKTIEEKNIELDELKKHWTHKLYNWFK